MPHANLDAVKYWEVTASTRWNERALELLARRPQPNAQAAASRILTYLSVAQYRAVVVAEKEKDRSAHPSVSAAVGAASVVVLSSFFPLDGAALEGQLDADLAAPPWPGAQHEDPASGEAIGRSIGASVLARAATDNYLAASPGAPPVGAGFWTSNGTPIVLSLYRARPFFWTPADQAEVPPPPLFGSKAFQDALAEIRSISDTRTAEQLRIAQLWAASPLTIGKHNELANDLIRNHRSSEREAARILAYGNVATFDAQIACWETKFSYWYIRPPLADPLITVPIPMPNHPSYPSGHSCVTAGILTVLADAFPNEREMLLARIEEAGLSRMYGGIHYRFDIEGGQWIGRRAAALALGGTLE